MSTRIEVPRPAEMVGRLTLAILGTGAIVALAVGLREQGSALDLMLTAGSVALTVALSGILGSIRPVSEPTTAVATILAGLRAHPVARLVLTDRAVQVVLALGVGGAVALAATELQAWLWPGAAADAWQQLIALAALLLPVWILGGLFLPRERAPWIVQVEAGIRQLLRLPERVEEPSTVARAVGTAVLRTLATVAVRSVSIVLLGWVLSSSWLIAAFALALVFLLAGGEVLGQLATAINGLRAPGAHVDEVTAASSDGEKETDQ
ncbi:hypothetical protein LG299_12515 [Microbacterium lacus]|uniref:hypothetical protein n=1 Tax=Microbacterium lacus TaxID=415217 RepID=UPI00384CEDF5